VQRKLYTGVIKSEILKERSGRRWDDIVDSRMDVEMG
jgi:hypothetical protein